MKIQTLLVAAVSAATLLAASSASAQATRTWVSGVGDDANPCSRTAPCKTLAGAISKTAAGGEIDLLDPAGVGGVTITKSISINAEWAGEGGVLVSGTNGIIINAGANDIINLRGLFVQGMGTGLSGVLILSAGQVHMQDMIIREFKASGATTGNGVLIQPTANNLRVSIDNSFIGTNGTVAGGGGVLIRPGAGAATVNVAIRNSNFEGNSGGVRIVNDGGGTGAIKVQVSDSIVSGSLGNGLAAISTSAAPIQLFIDNTNSSNNAAAGVKADGTGATVTIGRSTFTGNTGAGMLQGNSALLNSYKNNQSLLNGAADGATITTVTPN